MRPRKPIIAIVYDFDGTLSPSNMQEYGVFPKIRLKPKKFWDEVKEVNRRIGGEETITYMMLMLQKAKDSHARITEQDLGRSARAIRFFKGVEGFFPRINKFVTQRSRGQVALRHYIVSSGLKEILKRVRIRRHFFNIFASEYHYNEYDAPTYPKLVVTDTVKTQFLFRINKGRETISESINDYMPDRDRPIPFTRMIYIGDGLSDVPCMTVTTRNGGMAIAVYNPETPRKGAAKCKELFAADRVDFIAPADYSPGSELDRHVKTVLATMIQRIEFDRSQWEMMRHYMMRERT